MYHICIATWLVGTIITNGKFSSMELFMKIYHFILVHFYTGAFKWTAKRPTVLKLIHMWTKWIHFLTISQLRLRHLSRLVNFSMWLLRHSGPLLRGGTAIRDFRWLVDPMRSPCDNIIVLTWILRRLVKTSCSLGDDVIILTRIGRTFTIWRLVSIQIATIANIIYIGQN